MEKSSKLHKICLSNSNIRDLIEVICDNIKLSEKSIPKCAAMITEIMKKNISRLSRHPRNNEELKQVATYLNKLCIRTIIEIIVKKYPDLQINKRKQISREVMKRELDVYGRRDNHVPGRPYIRSRREYDDENEDDEIFPGHSNEPQLAGTDVGSSTYASAYGNHLITNVPIDQSYNNPVSQKDGTIEQRYQQYMNQRRNDTVVPQRPETPDFTLDGSGEKVKREKMLRKMQESQMTGENAMMNGMLPGMMGGDDIYASLLGPGAPQLNVPMMGNFMGMANPMALTQNNGFYLDQSNVSMLGNQSAKSTMLQSDFEKKLAERSLIDVETNQPQNKQSGLMNPSQNMMMPGMMPNFNQGMMSNFNQGMIPSMMPGMMPGLATGMMPNINS